MFLSAGHCVESEEGGAGDGGNSQVPSMRIWNREVERTD